MNSLSKALIGAIALLCASVIGIKTGLLGSRYDGITIGIIQTASHPALDAARQGFMDSLSKQLGSRVRYRVKNAQGSIPAANTIAASMHAHDHIDAIYAIATPASQAIAAIEYDKPIMIAAVTDHATINGNKNKNICGGSDKVDGKKAVRLLHSLLPEARTVGVISQTGDTNSEKEVVALEQELRLLGVTPRRIAYTTESDIPAAIIAGARSCDAIITPNYNAIASAMKLVSSLALEQSVPVIACYPDAVNQGALAAHGIDYYTNGEHAALCALDVLINKKQPHELPIRMQEGNAYINTAVAQRLGISLEQIPANAQRVAGDL